MKLREQFEVANPVGSVWSFLAQPAQVAECVPGVEEVTAAGQDDLQARLTQSVGPMTATFVGDVRIVERVPEQRLAFSATGKSVRGAAGNVRANVEVSLEQREQRTLVTVEAELALAGALGSVGQKVVAKQAGKVTTAFSRNLEQALGGTPPMATPAPASEATGGKATATPPTAASTAPTGSGGAPAPAAQSATAAKRWAQATTVLAAASLTINALALVRQLWRGRR